MTYGFFRVKILTVLALNFYDAASDIRLEHAVNSVRQKIWPRLTRPNFCEKESEVGKNRLIQSWAKLDSCQSLMYSASEVS